VGADGRLIGGMFETAPHPSLSPPRGEGNDDVADAPNRHASHNGHATSKTLLPPLPAGGEREE